ncbi:hypothetical protein RQP46_006699 [Phenoliferia psychrophenolica]
MTVTGTCNCESIVVEVPELPSFTVLCHCENCRKAGGTTGTLNYVFPGDQVVLKKGTTKTVNTQGTSGGLIERNFCGDCGSPIYSIATGTKIGDATATAYVKGSIFPMGTIAPPAAEVFCRNKESWEPTLPGVKTMQEQS